MKIDWTVWFPILMGWARHLLTLGAGFLVQYGWIKDSQQDQLVGAVVFLTTVAWSAYQKFHVKKKLVAAAATGNANPKVS